MAKAPDAFRTISEVADALHTPAHVLRFWESKFSQIKPVKRAGGRRYYRPDDIALLAGIKHLLHEQGLTIKGAQKLLRQNGVKYVAALVGSPIQKVEESNQAAQNVSVSQPEPKPTDNDVPLSVVPKPTPQIDVDLAALTPTDTYDDMLPRWFGQSGKLDTATVKANSAAILPLLERLEALRARLSAA